MNINTLQLQIDHINNEIGRMHEILLNVQKNVSDNDNTDPNAFLLALETKYSFNLHKINKAVTSNSLLLSQESERNYKKIQALENKLNSIIWQNDYFQTLSKEFNSLKQEYEQDKIINSQQIQQIKESSKHNNNTLVSYNTHFKSFLKQEDLINELKVFRNNYTPSNIIDQTNENMKLVLEQQIKKKADVDIIDQIQKQIKVLQEGQNQDSRDIYFELNQKLLTYAPMSSIENLTRQLNNFYKRFDHLINNQQKTFDEQFDSFKSRIDKLIRSKIDRLEDDLERLNIKTNTISNDQSKKDNNKDQSMLNLFEEMKKNLLNNEEFDNIKQKINENSQSIEEKIVNLFKLKVDVTSFNNFKSYCTDTYLTRDKGSDILYRLCKVEDDLTQEQNQLISFKLKIQPQVDQLIPDVQILKDQIRLEYERAANEESILNSNISDGIKKLEDEINSKLEKTDALKLTDNSKVLNSLVELDKVQKNLKRQVLKNVETIENLLHYSILNKKFKDTNESQKISQKNLLLSQCDRIKNNLKAASVSEDIELENISAQKTQQPSLRASPIRRGFSAQPRKRELKQLTYTQTIQSQNFTEYLNSEQPLVRYANKKKKKQFII